MRSSIRPNLPEIYGGDATRRAQGQARGRIGFAACGRRQNARHKGNEDQDLERAMSQSHKVFDDFSRLMNDATEIAQGVRREAEGAVKAQAERFLSAMDVVHREEFEAVREMAIAARDENDRLKKRIEALEAKLGLSSAP
jgi:BMFP domain-containing protein YqiC